MPRNVFVCYVTSGSYSDTEWRITHVFTDEQKAIDWVKGVDRFYNIVEEKRDSKEWKRNWYYRLDDDNDKSPEKAEILRLAEECNLGFKLFGDWDDYLVGMYDEMVVED